MSGINLIDPRFAIPNNADIDNADIDNADIDENLNKFYDLDIAEAIAKSNNEYAQQIINEDALFAQQLADEDAALFAHQREQQEIDEAIALHLIAEDTENIEHPEQSEQSEQSDNNIQSNIQEFRDERQRQEIEFAECLLEDQQKEKAKTLELERLKQEQQMQEQQMQEQQMQEQQQQVQTPKLCKDTIRAARLAFFAIKSTVSFK